MKERFRCSVPRCQVVAKSLQGLSLHQTKAHGRQSLKLDREGAALKELYRDEGEELGVEDMKVMIPSEYHKRLHGYKVLTGKTISSMVNEALDRYFYEQQQEEDADE